MAPRANWKGYLKVGEVVCPVALYTAASGSERIAFHIVNRKTGNRVRRQFVDEETGKPVEAADQVKGYERGPDDYLMLEPDEIAAALPDSDKTLSVQAFIPCAEIDDVYFDRPYYLGPGSPAARESYVLLREGLRAREVVAIAQTVLFRRVRTVLVRAYGAGLMAATLNFDYEVRSAAEAFQDIADAKIDREMLDLAEHIIATKRGSFDPKSFHDRYEEALADLVRAKLEGRPLPVRKPEPASNVVDLLDALRRSAEASGAETAAPASNRKAGGAKRVKKAASSKETPKPKPSARTAHRKAS
jgi:DNA end-binding protein Ku